MLMVTIRGYKKEKKKEKDKLCTAGSPLPNYAGL